MESQITFGLLQHYFLQRLVMQKKLVQRQILLKVCSDLVVIAFRKLACEKNICVAVLIVGILVCDNLCIYSALD